MWKVPFFCEGSCLRSVAENVEAGFSRAFEILQCAALKDAAASGTRKEISRRSPPQGMQEALLCLELSPPYKASGQGPRTGAPLTSWIPAGACPDCDGAGICPAAFYRDDALLDPICRMFKHDQLFEGEKVCTSSDAGLAPALSSSEAA